MNIPKDLTISDDNECDICFCKSNLIKTCDNDHYCCNDCIKKINKCHMCRGKILDIDSIIYTDVYSTNEIRSNNNIDNFIMSDYINENNVFNSLYATMNNNDLSMLTSAKQNKTYEAYNIIQSVSGNIITINSTSRWYSTLNAVPVSNSMGINTGIIIKLIVPCEKVAVDLSYVYGINNEIIILKGDYEFTVVTKTNNLSSVININLFTEENRERLITRNRTDKYYCTINNLKNICREHKITNFSKLTKTELIDTIILYNTFYTSINDINHINHISENINEHLSRDIQLL